MFGIEVTVCPKQSKTRPQLVLMANMKSCMASQMVPQMMTLDDLEWSLRTTWQDLEHTAMSSSAHRMK